MKHKNRITAIFSVLFLTLMLGLCGCGVDTSDITAVRSSQESSVAKKLRKQLEDEDITEITVDKDITVMGCLVVNGTKTINGSGSITLSHAAKAGIYQDVSIFDDVEAIVEEDFAQMLESSVIYVSRGAELTVTGDIVIDSNQVGNGVMVAKGGSMTIEEKATFMGGYYSNLYNEGTASVKGGSFEGAEGCNIISTGELLVAEGTISAATIHNVYVADGSATFSGGTVSDAEKANVYVDEKAETEILEGAAIQSGFAGIINYGRLVLDHATLEKNLTNLQNYGEAEIKDSSLVSSSVDNIVNEESGRIKLSNSDLTNSGSSAIINNKGNISFEALAVRRTNNEAIYNKGGNITGKELVIYGSAATALHNMDAQDGAGGDIKIEDLEIQTGRNKNIVQESCGTMDISDAVVGTTSVTNIKLVSGTLILDNVEIQGTTSTGAGVWTTGGKLEITNTTIKSTRGRGMALAGGEITGKNIVIEDIVNTGIGGMLHDNGYTSAKVELDNVTFNNVERENIATTADNADITINGGTFGKAQGNNVRAKLGEITLNDVEILGNTPVAGSDTKYHGVYVANGSITLNDCIIRDPGACAIRNKGGEVYATNLKTYNTPSAAITNAAATDGSVGNIKIDGLITYDAQLGAVRNDCSGTITITDGVLNESPANIAMVTVGKLVLNDVEINRSINPEDASYNNVYVRGGTLEMNSVTLKDSDSNGIRQLGGTIIGDDVTIKNASVNNLNIQGGMITLKNSTLGSTARTNVNLTTADAAVTLTNTKVEGAGDKNGNDVNCIYIAPGASVTLNDGTKISGSVTRAGVLSEGGKLIIDNTEISDNAMRGLTLKSKTVIDEKTNESILYEPSTTINNATIRDNGNATASGGALYNEGYAYVSNSTLSGNTATGGGAVNSSSASTTILENVVVKNNHVTGNGGGIHVTSGSVIKILGGNIVSNTADGKGDAVRVNSKNFYMYDSAVVNKNNDVYLEKGITIKTQENGIGNTKSNPLCITTANNLSGTILVESNKKSHADDLEGKVVCCDSEQSILESSAFEKYIVLGTKGEVDWTARILNEDGTYTRYLTLQEAIEAVPQTGVQTRVEILRSFTLNSALDIPENGNRNILLTDDGNGPYTITRGFTGGRMIILRTGNSLTIAGTGADDENPSLILDGGKLKAEATQQIIAVGTSVKNCHATLMMESGVKLTNNNNADGGGAIIVYGTLNMYGGVIAGNNTSSHGGAVYVQTTGVVNMTDGTISENTTEKSGGAIFIQTTGILNITGGIITDNSALESGGGIYQYAENGVAATTTIAGGTIKNNMSTSNGDDICVRGVLEMSGATDIGSVYLVSGKTITLAGALEERNTQIEIVLAAYDDGVRVLSGDAGVVSDNYQYFMPGRTEVTIDEAGCLVVDYEAQILQADGSYKKYITLAEAIDTVANNGTKTQIEILRNITLSAALDIDVAGCNIVLTDDGKGPYTISRGTALSGKEMILVRAGRSLTIAGTSEDDTKPSLVLDGGGESLEGEDQPIIKVGTLKNPNATLEIKSGVKLASNFNSGKGGAIFTYGTVNINGGVINGNTASSGGAIYAETTSSITVTGGNITGNIATGSGGGIYQNVSSGKAGTIAISGGTVGGNAATGNGIDVCIRDTLKMSEDAEVGSIYLVKGATIDLTSALNKHETKTEVVMPAASYVAGTRVLDGDATVIAESYQYFEVANGDWTIDKTGCLAEYEAQVLQEDGSYVGYLTLTDAIDAVPANSGAKQTRVEVMKNITLSAKLDIDVTGCNILLTDDGKGPYTITRGNSVSAQEMILVRTGRSLTIAGTSEDDTKPSLVLDGGGESLKGNNQPIIKVGTSSNPNATLEIKSGVKLTNNYNNNGGGAINTYGTVNIDGGVITVNQAKSGGGIYINSGAIVNMTGGTIVENIMTDKGKDICVVGTLKMSGTANVGSIYLVSGKTITLTEALSQRESMTEVVLPSYADGVQVLSGDTTIVAGNCQYFVPDGNEAIIDSTGCLVEYEAQVLQEDGSYVGYLTLTDAIDAVPANSGAKQTRVEVMKNITLSAKLDIDVTGCNILLTDDGKGPYTITRGNSVSAQEMILVRTGRSLTIAGTSEDDTKPSLVLDGGGESLKGNNQPIIKVGTLSNPEATLEIKSGVKLTNNYNNNGGGAINTYGTVNIDGGVITVNQAKSGGGIYINSGAIVNMTGGTIVENIMTDKGKDICVVGTLKMSETANVGSVYLTSNNRITLTEALSQRESMTEVVLPSYADGVQVLSGDAVTESYTYFKPANAEYMIDSEGKLKEK